MTEDSGGCVAIETFYIQTREDEDGDEYSMFATVPLQRMEGRGSVLTFYNGGSCDTAMALTGTGGTVWIDAFGPEGQSFGSTALDHLHHEAFSIGQRFPRTRGQLGMLRISGGAAVLGMDFCSGDLMQFRLAHLGPMAAGDIQPPESDPPDGGGSSFVVESFTVKLTNVGSFDHTFGVKVELRNPTSETRNYHATIRLKDSDGFLVAEYLLWPGMTQGKLGVADFCLFPAFCGDMKVPAGETREFLGNIKLSNEDGRRVAPGQSTVTITEWEGSIQL